MTATTRYRAVELSAHSITQRITFLLLAALCIVLLFVFAAAPLLNVFFSSFLRSDVIKDGTIVSYQVAENRPIELVETGMFTTWALTDPRLADSPRPHAEYVFKPIVALAPLVFVGGTILAALLTVVLPSSGGLIRQKIEREVLLALDRLAVQQFREHTADDLKQLSRDISIADARRLHDLAALYGIHFADLELLQNALKWLHANGIDKVFRLHDAIKFYMREYFTERYSNVILGLVYMGAAVLIIVIGIRGLKFLPATDPSVVLSALGLEFMLLVTYAIILMYGRVEESSSAPVVTVGSGAHQDASPHTEQLVRALLAVTRKSKGPTK